MIEEGRSALIVANGLIPPDGLITKLLTGSPYILAADGGADKLLEIGIVPDAVLGDFDSVSDTLPPQIKRLYSPDQNYTDLDKAVMYLREEGYTSITITAATGGRLDHTIGALSVLAKHGREVDLTLVDSVGTAKLVDGDMSIATEVGTVISLLALGRVSSITTSGLKWDLNNEFLSTGLRDGISNVAVAQLITINAAEGDLIVYIHSR